MADPFDPPCTPKRGLPLDEPPTEKKHFSESEPELVKKVERANFWKNFSAMGHFTDKGLGMLSMAFEFEAEDKKNQTALLAKRFGVDKSTISRRRAEWLRTKSGLLETKERKPDGQYRVHFHAREHTASYP